MKLLFLIFLNILLLFSTTASSDDSMYCPQNHAYISIGMNQAQVLSACGKPTKVKASGQAVVKQIPVTQVIYTTLNKGAVFFYPGIDPLYTMFSLPSGSEGTTVEIDLIKNQITSIKINGSSNNALSVCKGGQIQIGDDLNKVYNACGPPSNINNTYINQPIPRSQHPEVWIYTVGEYQPGFTLTFVNGILQSIQ
jgi:hypothetical protein